MDAMSGMVGTEAQDAAAVEAAMIETLKLKGRIELSAPGTLPRDGKVIDDQRSYD